MHESNLTVQTLGPHMKVTFTIEMIRFHAISAVHAVMEKPLSQNLIGATLWVTKGLGESYFVI